MGAESSLREHNRLLDEYCHEIGRDPGSVERAYLHWGEEASPGPFVSRDAFEEFVGRYRDAGVQRFVFLFRSAAFPTHAEYDALVAAGAWASRKPLEAFAAQAMREIRDSSNSHKRVGSRGGSQVCGPYGRRRTVGSLRDLRPSLLPPHVPASQ
jgi:hypothetical protein